jgi:hypothetical protein
MQRPKDRASSAGDYLMWAVIAGLGVMWLTGRGSGKDVALAILLIAFPAGWALLGLLKKSRAVLWVVSAALLVIGIGGAAA